MAHDQQIVGDEQIGQAEFFLQLGEHVDDLRLDRHVQRGDRLVADDELGVHSQCTGNAHAQTMKSGLTASARAMPMRWRWPPENSWA